MLYCRQIKTPMIEWGNFFLYKLVTHQRKIEKKDRSKKKHVKAVKIYSKKCNLCENRDYNKSK